MFEDTGLQTALSFVFLVGLGGPLAYLAWRWYWLPRTAESAWKQTRDWGRATAQELKSSITRGDEK